MPAQTSVKSEMNTVQYHSLCPNIVTAVLLLYILWTRPLPPPDLCLSESFNNSGRRGYDDSVPGKVTKTAPFGIGIIVSRVQIILKGVGQICPRE